MSIKTIVVDDEPLARENMAILLGEEEDIEVAAFCANGLEALAAIEAHKPDLLFLDIQMPQLSGFDVLARLKQPPVIIFVTAHDRYAIEAFEKQALDYLLKPFTDKRLRVALARARRQIGNRDVQEQYRNLLEHMGHRHEEQYPKRLAIHGSGHIYFLCVDEIDWIAGAGNYVEIHSGARTHLQRETMSHLETRLDPRVFPRIHRSTMVNAERIAQLKPIQKGEYQVILEDGTQLKLSRSYRDNLTRILGC